MPMQINKGALVKFKKAHPCGGDVWEVMRTGMDFRIKCQTCGRVVMLPRPKFEKAVKCIIEDKGIDDEE